MLLLLLLPSLVAAFAYAPVPSLPAAPSAYGSPWNTTFNRQPLTITWSQILPPRGHGGFPEKVALPIAPAVVHVPSPIVLTTPTSLFTASPPPPQSFDQFSSNIENLGDDWSIIGPPAFDAPNNTHFEPTNKNLANALTGGLDDVTKSDEFVAKLTELSGNSTEQGITTLQRTPEIDEED